MNNNNNNNNLSTANVLVPRGVMVDKIDCIF